MNVVGTLTALGQSLWLDNIRRRSLADYQTLIARERRVFRAYLEDPSEIALLVNALV